jgi:hypothetical protein
MVGDMKAWLPAAMILVISVGWAADAPPLPTAACRRQRQAG